MSSSNFTDSGYDQLSEMEIDDYGKSSSGCIFFIILCFAVVLMAIFIGAQFIKQNV